MRIEEYLEDAMKAIMEARSGVIALGYGVFKYKDWEDFKGDQAFVVRPFATRKLHPNFNAFETRVDLAAVSNRNDDTTGQHLDDAYNECSDEINNDLTPATLQAALDSVHPDSGMSIDDHVPQEGGNEGEIIFGQVASTLVYLRYTKPTT